MPRFEVRAPEIPNLKHSLNGVELALHQIQLRDGTVHRAPKGGPDPGWSQWVRLAEAWGTDGLEGAASFETGATGDSSDVEALRGAVVLRVPRNISTLSMERVVLGQRVEAPGLSVQLSELGRDRLVLRSEEGGDRVLAVRVYNSTGEALWMSGAEAEGSADGWRGEFRFQGVPSRLEVIVAGELETAEYPFALEVAAL